MDAKVSKIKLNLSIDIIMFIILMALTGIGLMIKYVLIPGFLRNQIYGENVELYFIGLDRHQWGNIHLIISFVFLFLLILHIVFHWKLIVSVFKAMVGKRNPRIVFVISFVFLSLLLGVSPLFINPEIKEDHANHHNHLMQVDKHIRQDGFLVLDIENSHHSHLKDAKSLGNSASKVEQKGSGEEKICKHTKHTGVEVYGFMTLNQLALKFNIPIDNLASSIGVPKELADEKLGRLRKQYNFEMGDLKNYIEVNSKE